MSTKQCCERDHNHDGNCDRHPKNTMSTKHTPGKWQFDRQHQTVTAPDGFICKLAGPNPSDPELIANGELIASAPDLLAERDRLREALKDVVSTLEFLLPPERTMANAMKFGGTSYDALWAGRAALNR